MIMMPFDFNELVEANLLSIAFNQDSKAIVLRFRSADESRDICITASQVVDFLGEDFRTCNIVDFVRVFSGEGPSDEDLREALTYVFRGSSSDVVPPQLELHASMVRKKELVLLDFVPVCGALIMVLARDVRVEVSAVERS